MKPGGLALRWPCDSKVEVNASESGITWNKSMVPTSMADTKKICLKSLRVMFNVKLLLRKMAQLAEHSSLHRLGCYSYGSKIYLKASICNPVLTTCTLSTLMWLRKPSTHTPWTQWNKNKTAGSLNTETYHMALVAPESKRRKISFICSRELGFFLYDYMYLTVCNKLWITSSVSYFKPYF